MAESPDRLVWLRGGFIVPAEPLLLLLRLESCGFRFRLAGDGMPEVGPFDELTAADRAALRRWRNHIVLLLQYMPDDVNHIGSGSEADAADGYGQDTN